MKSTWDMQASYFAYSCSTMGSMGLATRSAASAGTAGTLPSKYLFVMLNTRLHRLPQVLARSALYTCTMRSMEMLPSWPNCTSDMK